ncbi:hypothetical protein [Variovorax sp. AFSI2.2]
MNAEDKELVAVFHGLEVTGVSDARKIARTVIDGACRDFLQQRDPS